MPYQDKDPHRTGIGARFPTGKIVYSNGITALVASDPVAATTLNAFLRFHQNGQWGSVAAEDAQANEQALIDSFRKQTRSPRLFGDGPAPVRQAPASAPAAITSVRRGGRATGLVRWSSFWSDA